MRKATSKLLLLLALLCVTSTPTLAQAPPNALFLDAGVQKNALASRQTERLSRLEQKSTTLETEVVRVADLRDLIHGGPIVLNVTPTLQLVAETQRVEGPSPEEFTWVARISDGLGNVLGDAVFVGGVYFTFPNGSAACCA